MINNTLRESLEDKYVDYEQTEKPLMFDNPSFDKSVIGISLDNRLVYDLESMVEEYMEDNNCDYDTALEFIEYNTLRALAYNSDESKPIVIEYTKKDLE